jgi:hypothetical protein
MSNYDRLTPARIEVFHSRYDAKGVDECWIWNGALSVDGYGHLFLERNHDTGRVHKTGAHCIAWMLGNGPIPGGMVICHRCDNPPCVNPSHLFIGTQADNMRDCIAKGRHPWVAATGSTLNGRV